MELNNIRVTVCVMCFEQTLLKDFNLLYTYLRPFLTKHYKTTSLHVSLYTTQHRNTLGKIYKGIFTRK